MAYRNGTYVAFHANGEVEPSRSDRKYLELFKTWKLRSDDDFKFTDSHDKANAVKDSSKRETLERSLKTRLLNSKNMVLIIGQTTKQDDDWVPFEITYAIDNCEIPIIAAYPDKGPIRSMDSVSGLWPSVLAARINDGRAHVIHVPVKKLPLGDAISQFGPNRYPVNGGKTVYKDSVYKEWGLL